MYEAQFNKSLRAKIDLENSKYNLEGQSKVKLDKIFEIISEENYFGDYSEVCKWFILNGEIVERKDPSGNFYSSEIKFSPCYLKMSDNIASIIEKGIKEKPDLKEKYSRLNWKIRNGKSIPITCVIECCDALDKDLWDNLEGEKLSAKTSSQYITLPPETSKIEKLVTWIVTEGHIPLSHPSIEINQVSSQSSVLDELAETIEDVFEAKITNFSETEKWSGESGRRLIISSAAVRQFLVLKYGIPLGKKSKRIDWKIPVTDENYKELLLAFIKSEGCFSHHKNSPRFEFKIQDKGVRDACIKCLKKLNCKPQSSKKNTWNAGIYSIEDFIRIHHFLSSENDDYAETTNRLLEDSNILEALKREDWCELVDEARNRLSDTQPNQEFVELHEEVFPNENINHAMVSSWALNKVPARFSAALIAWKITEKQKEQIFDPHIQSYISSSSLEKYVESKL